MTSIYSDTARSEHRDAGVCIVKQNAALLELPEGEITCMTLETSNRGYIISRNGSTLSVNVFLINPLAIKPQHDLNQTVSITETRSSSANKASPVH